MKKAIVFLLAFTFSMSAFAITITVYGRNEGTTVTIEDNGDGTSTTTHEISCDNFHQETCYELNYGRTAPRSDNLTFGNDPTPVVVGTFVSHSTSTNTAVFITTN